METNRDMTNTSEKVPISTNPTSEEQLSLDAVETHLDQCNL